MRNFGPEGLLLLGCATFWVVLGSPFLIVGFGLMFISRFHTEVAAVGFFISVPWWCFCTTGVLRNLQANRLGERFRNGRPLELRMPFGR